MKRTIIMIAIIVVVIATPFVISFARNAASGYGYGGPPVTPTATLIPTATQTQVPVTQPPVKPTPTLVPPTSTPAGVVTGGLPIEDSVMPIQVPVSEIIIPKLWGQTGQPIANVEVNTQGMLIPPIGQFGKFGNAYFAHLDYLSQNGRGMADIGAKLAYLKVGDTVQIGGTTYTVIAISNNIPAQNWAADIANGVTISTCQPGSWNGHEYTQRLIVYLTKK